MYSTELFWYKLKLLNLCVYIIDKENTRIISSTNAHVTLLLKKWRMNETKKKSAVKEVFKYETSFSSKLSGFTSDCA